MPVDLISGLLLLFALIICIIIYLVLVNILKFIISIRFIANLVNDFKKAGKKYLEPEGYPDWNPWKFR